MLRLTDRVGARTDRLRLERLDRPVLAHFPGNDAFDIVLEIHHVDDIDVPAAHALVLKAAVVAVAAEPRDRLFTRLDRQNAEVFAPTAVEFKEDRIRSCHNDRHTRAAAADCRAAVLGCRGPCRAQARVAASARIERAILVGSEAAAVLRRCARRVVVIVKRAGKLHVIGRVRHHRDLFIQLRQCAQLFKAAVRVKIPQRVAAEGRIILKVRRAHRVRAVLEPHAERLTVRCLRERAQRKAQQTGKQERSAPFFHSILHSHFCRSDRSAPG